MVRHSCNHTISACHDYGICAALYSTRRSTIRGVTMLVLIPGQVSGRCPGVTLSGLYGYLIGTYLLQATSPSDYLQDSTVR